MAERGRLGNLVHKTRRVQRAAPPPAPSRQMDAESPDDLLEIERVLEAQDDNNVARLATSLGRQDEFEAILATRQSVSKVALSEDSIDAFFARGFLVVEEMSSPEELGTIRQIYDRLFETQAGRSGGLYSEVTAEAHLAGEVVYPKIHQVYRVAPELCATGFMANARTIAGQLLGTQVEFLGGHGFVKPPMCPSTTPWHQDQAYHRSDLLYRNVNFWLALQDCPPDAGVMEFVPGSHRNALVHEHRRPGGRADAIGLELADDTKVRDVVPCPLSAGSATLHHSYMLHYTGPNNSEASRRALIATFGLPPEQRAAPLYFPWQQQPEPNAPGR